MEFEVKGGKLAVEVQAASDQEGWATEGGREYWTEAEVRVSGIVKVRGIEYTVKVDYRWLREARQVYVKGKETGKTTHWQWDYNKWAGGYRRVDTNKKVDNGTPTDDAIDAMVLDALNQFNQAEPNWQRDSFKLRLEYLVRQAEGEAASRRKEAEEYDARAAKLRAQLAAL